MKKLSQILLILMVTSILLCGCQENKQEHANLDITVTPSRTSEVEPVNMPEFIDVEEAIKILKTRPVGIGPWEIEYVGEEYVYITYSSGVEIIFRYSIKENAIDRALDLRNIHKEIITSHTSFKFLSNGLYAYFTIGNFGETYQNVYKADFSDQSVELLNETADDFWRRPFGEEYYEKEEFGKSVDEYLLRLEKNPNLPALNGWSTVAQIDDDRFFVISPNQLPGPGEGYYYFNIAIIDVSRDEIIKKYNFSDVFSSDPNTFESNFESIKEIMTLKKEDVIKKLGEQYKVEQSHDYSQDRYNYEQYGIAVVFDKSNENTNKAVEKVVCDDKVNIKGAKLGMTLSEIEELLGEGTKRDLVKNPPDDPSYAEYFLIDDLMIWFAGDTEDGPTTKLEVRRYNGPN